MASVRRIWAAIGASFVLSGGLSLRIHRQAEQIEALAHATGGDEWVAERTRLEARIAALEVELGSLRLGAPGSALVREEAEEATGEAETPPGSDGIVAIGNVFSQSPEEIERREQLNDAVLEALESESGEARERLRSIIREEQSSLREQRRQQWRQGMVDRMKERVKKLASSAGLSSASTEVIIGKLSTESDQIDEVFSKAHEEGSFADARSKREEIRRKTDEEVKAELDETSYAAYEQMRREEERQGPWHGPPARPARSTNEPEGN